MSDLPNLPMDCRYAAGAFHHNDVNGHLLLTAGNEIERLQQALADREAVARLLWRDLTIYFEPLAAERARAHPWLADESGMEEGDL